MIWQEILIILLLIVLNGFFALSELALVSARKARLQQYVEEGRRGAVTAMRLAEDPTRFLSAVQVGITLIAILSGAYGEAALAAPLAEALQPIAFIGSSASSVSSTIVIVALTFVSLVIGELVPKRLALRNPERLACLVAPVMRLVSIVAHPIIWFLRWVTELILRLFAQPTAEDPRMTEEEVKTLIAEGTEAGVWPDVVWIDLDDGIEEAYKTIAGSGHSRFPVAKDDVDNVIGIVHAKDLLEQSRKGGPVDFKSIARDPIYIHESTPVLKLLESFQASTVHMAVVLDEHGTVQGIVTPTDILVGIAGDLPEREGDDQPSAVMRADGSWLLDGQMPVYDVERTLDIRGLSTSDEEYTTIAGFVLTQLGHIPAPGEFFDWQAWRFEVMDLDGRRIDKVLVSVKGERSQ
jgi:putative hemolysin